MYSEIADFFEWDYKFWISVKRPGVSTKEHTPDENPEGSLSTLNGVTIPTCLSMFR